MDGPTNDLQLLQQRAEEVRRWSELYGKVRAGEASEEEIHSYYGYLRQVSEEYLSVVSGMLHKHREQLSERDRGLLVLSMELHRARLQSLPRQLEEALARKRLQDQRREQWRINKKTN
jgi:hypothetical protein